MAAKRCSIKRVDKEVDRVIWGVLSQMRDDGGDDITWLSAQSGRQFMSLAVEDQRSKCSEDMAQIQRWKITIHNEYSWFCLMIMEIVGKLCDELPLASVTV